MGSPNGVDADRMATVGRAQHGQDRIGSQNRLTDSLARDGVGTNRRQPRVRNRQRPRAATDRPNRMPSSQGLLTQEHPRGARGPKHNDIHLPTS